MVRTEVVDRLAVEHEVAGGGVDLTAGVAGEEDHGGMAPEDAGGGEHIANLLVLARVQVRQGGDLATMGARWIRQGRTVPPLCLQAGTRVLARRGKEVFQIRLQVLKQELRVRFEPPCLGTRGPER